MLYEKTTSRLLALFLILSLSIFPIAGAADSAGTLISGRILDVAGGLPVPNAAVQLMQGDKAIASSTTDTDGVYQFKGEPEGVYSILVSASGYQTTRSGAIRAFGEQIDLQTAIQRSSDAMRTIGQVRTSSSITLQSTATITEHLDASILQNQGYLRAGDAVGTLPFVNSATSSSLGDDLTLSIRGFDPTETATLLDGHPIGPIGAEGSGFDYQISPFWGLNSIDVTYGSGAAGIYGVSTIAGAVNFETIEPTRVKSATLIQGAGSNGKMMTGFQATGTVGKLGYAASYGVQGVSGPIDGFTLQQGNLGSDADGYPSLTSANKSANTYLVTGNYLMRNNVFKLVYTASPKTKISLTSYIATSWDDKSGNGDTDFNSSPYVLYNANRTLAGQGNQTWINNASQGQTVLSNINGGNQVTCTGSMAVLVNAAPGYQCMTPQQYAANFCGPAGGGPDRWQDMRNQDYHARIEQQAGAGTILLDGFVDNYGQDQSKGFGGPYPSDIFITHGLLISDEFASAMNDFAFGFYSQHQDHLVYEDTVSQGEFNLTSSSYFVRDAWSPTLKFSVFSNIWFQHSYNTDTTNLDPRVSLVYRPTARDIVRVTGGRSYSEPDPSLIGGLYSFGAPLSLNPVCGTGDLNSIGSGNNPYLKPETAQDVEVAYGHRFSDRAVVQADIYSAVEAGPLLSGTFPLSLVPPGQLPNQAALDQYLQRIQTSCGPGYTDANLGVSTTFNAGSATYQGVGVNANVEVSRHLKMIAEVDLQAAKYYGISDTILSTNPGLINGAQFYGIPERQGSLAFLYQNEPSGVNANLITYYVGGPSNGFNRGNYAYANANVSKTFHGSVTLNLGVTNLFNSAAQEYGLIGLGVFHPENQFGTDENAFDQGSEEFGLPERQVWFTISTRI